MKFFSASLILCLQLLTGYALDFYEKGSATKDGENPVYYTIDNRQYYISSLAKKWQVVNEECHFWGMHPVNVETVDKSIKLFQWLYLQPAFRGVNFWTGGMRVRGSPTWYWTSTGQQMTETDWIGGQPDEEFWQDAIVVLNSDNDGWVDEINDPFNGTAGMICEF